MLQVRPFLRPFRPLFALLGGWGGGRIGRRGGRGEGDEEREGERGNKSLFDMAMLGVGVRPVKDFAIFLLVLLLFTVSLSLFIFSLIRLWLSPCVPGIKENNKFMRRISREI